MKNIDLGKLLRIIDRRILILIIVGFVGIIGVQRFFVSSTSDALSTARIEQKELSETTESLEGRVEEILSDGTSSIDTMITRISSMETSIPSEVDDLEFSAEIYRLAGDRVLIENIAVADTPEQKAGDVRYVLYQVTGKTPFGILSGFVQQLGVTGKYIVTVREVKISQDSRSNTLAPQQTSEALNTSNSNTNFDLTLMVWYDDTKRVVVGELSEDATPGEGATSPAPSPANPQPENG